jgi:hypothetical protein
MTQPVVEVTGPFGIAVHGHIIVGCDEHVRCKGQGLRWPFGSHAERAAP